MTSPEVGAELEKAGWRLIDSGRYNETWRYGWMGSITLWLDGTHNIESYPTMPLGALLQFCAIAGIAPQGYRITKEG